MTARITVGALVAEFLERCGVEMAFGIISVHNVPLLDALHRRGTVRFVMCRGEMGGTHMADGYARVSGRLGVVYTSTGPGAASAVSGLVEARFAGSPVLHITGQSATPLANRDLASVHDVPDQIGMLKSVSKAAYTVRTADSALGILMHAAAEALTPPLGPVSVEIPIDIQLAETDRPAALDGPILPRPPIIAPLPEAIERLAAAVQAARRPLLWTGGGAREAGTAVTRLAALGIPVVTSWNGRGVIPEDHPLCLGPLATTPEVERFYEEVDLMLVAGSRLRGHETRDGNLRLPTRRIQIDADARANGRTYACEQFVHADATATLVALADRLEGRWNPAPDYADEISRLKTEATDAYRATLGDYAPLPSILRDAMPRDAVWVRDISFHHTTWANRIFPVYGPRDSIYSVGAAIGTGMPLAIGAALAARGRKTVAMCGDGGFALNLGEIMTVAQEQPDLCLLIMNDGGYGVIRHIQNSTSPGPNYYDALLAPDFELLARSAGMPYWRATSLDDVGKDVAAALEHRGPTLVEVEMTSIGPFAPKFQAPTYAGKK
ncbi:MAG: thiamine pyrophosphate-binding protein [Phycisphaerales bacterium]|nr:thiamine pyrophosphate-binding protein [Phycisphaerales bacterium]